MTKKNCPHCSVEISESFGPGNAPILFIAEYGDYGYMRERVTEILHKELALVGIQHAACRHAAIWNHRKPLKPTNVNDHVDQLLKEMEGRDWVVLMGSEATKAFFGVPVLDVCGLELKSKMFPKVKFFAIPSPFSLLAGDVGEMRLALEKFKEIRNGKSNRSNKKK